jgi:hypothetical protein
MRTEIQLAIKGAELNAMNANIAAQNALPRGTCFEGELYGVVNNPNCDRQYTNSKH